MTDLISRADAIEAVCGDCTIENRESCKRDGYCYEVRNLMALPSAEAVQLRQTDTLIIADALRYLAQDTERHESDRTRADALREQILKYGASMCHSDEAVQGEWLDGWEVIKELSETRCMYNCFDENDRPMYEAMTSAIDIVRQMMGGDTECVSK